MQPTPLTKSMKPGSREHAIASWVFAHLTKTGKKLIAANDERTREEVFGVMTGALKYSADVIHEVTRMCRRYAEQNR